MANMMIDCANKYPGKSYNHLWEVLIGFRHGFVEIRSLFLIKN